MDSFCYDYTQNTTAAIVDSRDRVWKIEDDLLTSAYEPIDLIEEDNGFERHQFEKVYANDEFTLVEMVPMDGAGNIELHIFDNEKKCD